MKLTEVFEEIGVGCDDKARRVSNVSSRVASISAEEIEAGVTLERLATIGVPVLRYQTQVTIHGVLPDFSPEARPNGYKSIFRNANGSIGVRYVAIDADKKRLAVNAGRYGNRTYSLRITSVGMEVFASYETKDACLAGYRAFPRHLICGNVTAGAGAMGGFYVFATVGAIPADNLWSFIEAMTGISSEAQLNEKVRAEEERSAAAAAQRAQQVAANEAAAEKARSEAASKLQNRRLSALPAKGFFVRISFNPTTGVARPFLCLIQKRGPIDCYASTPYTGQKTFVPEGKMRKLELGLRALLAKDLTAGRIMEA